jgi:hypothetical protein
MFNFKRLLHTDIGKNIISLILGLGLATLFHKVCKDKDCIIFDGPVISDVDGKIFKQDNDCYKYEIENAKCDATKKIIKIAGGGGNKPANGILGIFK